METGHRSLSLSQFDRRELRRKLLVPEVLARPDDVAAAGAEVVRLLDEAATWGRKHEELVASRPQAAAADQAVLREAMRAGKANPGAQASVKLEAEIDDAFGRLDGFELAAHAAALELEALVVERRTEWLASIGEVDVASGDRIRDAIAALESAWADKAAAEASASWVRGYPSGGGKFTASPYINADMRSPAGERYTFAQIVAALRADVDPPPSKPKALVKPLPPAPRLNYPDPDESWPRPAQGAPPSSSRGALFHPALLGPDPDGD